MPTSNVGLAASNEINAALSVVDSLRSDTMLHAEIIKRMAIGVAQADSNEYEYAPASQPNYYRWISMNNQIGKLLVEHNFIVEKKGLQMSHEKECKITPTLVKIVLARGNKMVMQDKIVFAANPKSNGIAVDVAENLKHSGFVNSLFDMEELEALREYIFGSSFESGPAVTTLFIFWEPSPRLDLFEDETIKVYLAKPVSLNAQRNLIEVQWAEYLGFFSPNNTPSVDVTAVDLSPAPSFQPSVIPLNETEDARF